MDLNCILFRIDVHFSEDNLSVKVDGKRTYWQRSYRWKKNKKKTTRKLDCKFMRINTSKENYDANLLQLILAKKITMQIMKLVEYKHLLTSSKVKN